jgi:hypothetical protein
LKKDDAMYGRCIKLADNRFKADYMYKENALICFFEGDTGRDKVVAMLPHCQSGCGGRAMTRFARTPQPICPKFLLLRCVALTGRRGANDRKKSEPALRQGSVD